MYSEIPVLCIISATLSLVPLASYLRARNIAAMAIGIWLSVTNAIYAVDTLIWANNADIKASVWCDLSTCVITGSRIALPAACLSICIHLERLASFCTPQAKQRRVICECLTCFGIPLLYVALHLAVQPRRFDLFHGFGCRPATYPTIATIFLMMIPPLLLTAATIVCTGMTWRHFLVHGVQFCGKRGSLSSLTRNSYLRLIGMALFEAVCSAILVIIVMWSVLSSGLVPLGNMSRDLSEVLVRESGAITDAVRATLQIEWSVTAGQSVVFFGLFACRMDVVREGWELVHRFPRILRTSNVSVTLGHGTSERSSTSITVPALPLTEVDLSLVIRSAGTFTAYGQSIESLPSKPCPYASRPASLIQDVPDDVISAVASSITPPLESPSHASIVASSHNSLDPNFDPSRIGFSAHAWPQTPTAIPRYSFGEKLVESWFELDVPFPRAKVATHARSRLTNISDRLPTYEPGIYVTVVRETR